MIYSYVKARVEDGAWSGVPKFDLMLRRVFPEMQSITRLPELHPDDIVITDNHMSLDVPDDIKTIVVFHGSARVHYERDPEWRQPCNKALVDAQEAMIKKPNRIYIAPSYWVAEQFPCISYHIPHWVEMMPARPKPGKPIIIGDWRNYNKGSSAWPRLAEANPQWEFKPLNHFSDKEKREQYGSASLYLCLSLSEGGSYSMCDAEAAGLPIVTTDVGNYREFPDCEVIPWQERDNVSLVSMAIDNKMSLGRMGPSFYQSYSFERWAELWRDVIAL